MSAESVVHLSPMLPLPSSSDEISPRQLLCSLVGQEMPKGVLIAWIDDNNHVHVRRAQLSEGHELDILRTARKMLVEKD